MQLSVIQTATGVSGIFTLTNLLLYAGPPSLRIDASPQRPHPMAKPLVIFDLDGTLLHTAPDLMTSLNHSIDHLGLEPIHYDEMNFLVGAGAKAMITRALELRERRFEDSEIEALFEKFIAFYSSEMPGETAPYPGLLDALDRLEDAGMNLAICTNKTEALAKRLIDLLALTERFATIVGGDTFSVRKPHADHIHGTIAQSSADASSAIMIGDSINDIQAARNAGIPSIAVPFGYTDTPVEQLEPDVIIQHFDELTPELVAGLLKQG